jgi:hypothetical protein
MQRPHSIAEFHQHRSSRQLSLKLILRNPIPRRFVNCTVVIVSIIVIGMGQFVIVAMPRFVSEVIGAAGQAGDAGGETNGFGDAQC